MAEDSTAPSNDKKASFPLGWRPSCVIADQVRYYEKVAIDTDSPAYTSLPTPAAA